MLYKDDNYIIHMGETGSTIHHTDGSGCLTFNFENMWTYIGTRKSQKRPIRYCDKKQCLVYWYSGSWNAWTDDLQECINKMFHNYCDSELLKD